VSVLCYVIRSSDEQPFTSYVRMAGRCVNCSLRCDGYLCRHCEDHVQCVNCRRYLPQHCYSDTSKRCLACTKKLSETRSTARNIVNRQRAVQNRLIALSSPILESYKRSSKTTGVSMAPYAYTSVLMPSSRDMSKAACYKEYPHFFRVPFKMSTRLNKST